MKPADVERHREQSEKVAADARAAGLKIVGLISPDTGWRPGCVLAHALGPRVYAFAREHHYIASPSGTRATILEVLRGD